MTGWMIFGSILLLIIILSVSVTVTVIYDANPEVRIKILCFTIVKIPADPKTLEKKKQKQKKKEERERKKLEKQQKKASGGKQTKSTAATTEIAEPVKSTQTAAESIDTEKADNDAGGAKRTKAPPTDDNAGKDKAPKKKLNLNFDMIMDYVRSASPPIKRLFRKIRIRDVYVDWVVGSDEAGKTALKYGGLCTAFYSLQEWLTTYFDAKIGEINIEADFQAEKDDIFAYITLKLRIGTALGCVLWLGVRVLKTFLKYNSKPKANKVKMKPASGRGR